MITVDALSSLAFHSWIHLLVFGALIHLATGVVLRSSAVKRLTRRRPRAAYVLTVIAFVAAVILPLLIQGHGITTGAPPGTVEYEEREIVEASWLLGRSVSWPLMAPASHELEAWWRWLAIGPGSHGLLKVWGFGIFLLTLSAAVGWLRFRKLQRHWQEAPKSLLRVLGIPNGVRLLIGSGGSPLATGLWRPAIYLPRWSIEDLEPAALERVVRHELAHVRWRDPGVDRCVRAIRGLLWPAWPLWSLAHRVQQEREAAADSEALGLQSTGDASIQGAMEYAETLFAVAARRCGPVPTVGITGDLEARISRLLETPHRPTARARVVPALLLLAGTVTLAANPLPAGSVAKAPTPHGVEDPRSWGPLDHYLGFNPRVELTIAPGIRSLRIQGQELDHEQIDHWLRSTSLEEKAAIVLAADALARRASPD